MKGFKALVIGFAFGMVVSSQAIADEIKTVCGIAPYENVFAKIEPKLKEAGHKLTFITDMNKTGADVTLSKVLSGEADLGSAALPWTDWMKLAKEKKVADDAQLAQIVHRVIGKDVLKVMAHPKLTVDKLSMEQLQKVFTGEIKNWKEVGGADQPVVVVLQTTYPATNNFFKKAAMSGKDFVGSAIQVQSIPEAVEKIGATPGAIGFNSSQTPSGSLKIVKTEEIGRPVTALTKGKPSDKVLKLFEVISREVK